VAYKDKEKEREHSRTYRLSHKEEVAESLRVYRETNKEKINTYNRAYRLAHLEGNLLRGKAYRDIHSNEINARHRVFYAEHKEKIKEQNRKSVKNLRETILSAYGGKCACCGEIEPMFLGIDHINGGGNQQRKILGSGRKYYNWLIENKFPPDFQILCHNCNLAKGFYGVCPHEIKRAANNGILPMSDGQVATISEKLLSGVS
jgi:hypothetical protein